MAAVAPLRPDPTVSPSTRTPLRIAPTPRRRTSRLRDVAWVVTVGLLLTVGIITVLLLNTAMQTQADRIAASRQQLADLTLHAQVLQAAADEADSPEVLAARARQLHLRPATGVQVLRATTPAPSRRATTPAPSRRATARLRRAGPVSARARAARRGRAG